METTVLPALGAARTIAALPKARKEDKDDQTIAINKLCKTLQATVQNLMFSFLALQSASAEAEGSSIA